jgi:hypothetical protein
VQQSQIQETLVSLECTLSHPLQRAYSYSPAIYSSYHLQEYALDCAGSSSSSNESVTFSGKIKREKFIRKKFEIIKYFEHKIFFMS